MRRPTLAIAALAALALSAAAAASAQTPPAQQSRPTSPNCPSDEAVGQLARNLLENRPSPAFTGMTSLEDRLCAQDKLVRILQSHWGRPVGYKLALTVAADKRSFVVTAVPVRYGRTGMLSFYADSRGVRAADARGGAVGGNAPLVPAAGLPAEGSL